MYERLGESTLKSGEQMEIGVITAPDTDWRDRIVPFLGHKQEPYATHIRRSNDGPLDTLQTHYYVGHLAGEVISEVMIVGARGAGILGHVYTRPEHRRKGAYQAVMAAQMADMPHRGFRLLSLGIGFDSAPYWIYHSYGFRGIGAGRGEMVWSDRPESEAELFRQGAASVRPVQWDDWGYFGWLGLLPLSPEEELPRSGVMGLWSRGIAEGPFVRLMIQTEEKPGFLVRVLQSEHGATVGWAVLAPPGYLRSPGGSGDVPIPQQVADAWTLDLHVQPGFAGCLPALAKSIAWPDAPVATPLTEPAGAKAVALQKTGFRRAAALPDWFIGDDRRPVALWTRT
jgi:hypothetical protein